MGRAVQRYGWLPDHPDPRDFVAAPELLHAGKPLPSKVNLRPNMPEVYDQGELGSCTANAIGAAVQFDDLLQFGPRGVPSRLFIYYGERELEGTIDQDSGAMIRDGIKVVAKQGAPPETDWPYLIERFTERPPQQAYADATKNRAVAYARVPQTLQAIKGALAAGHPVVIGFTVYEGFESQRVAAGGVLNMPDVHREQVMGGHAVLVSGYDDAENRWLVRNSWGAGWGMEGYFTMPYQYLLDPGLASDFWTITRTS